MDKDLFDQTIKELVKIAEKDGVITPEELDIIEQVKIDADSYHLNLLEAIADGKITDEESTRLKKLKNLILDRAQIIADVDGHLSNDEKQLIESLKDFITNHYSE